MSDDRVLSDGARLFQLLTRQAEWIHRRVDRTDLEADGETRRRISFDLTITESLAIPRDGGFVVPLTLMTKTPLRRLDTTGPDGHSLPVLSRPDNGALVEEMLLEAFRSAADEPIPSRLEEAVRAGVMERNPDWMQRRHNELEAAAHSIEANAPDHVEAVLALAFDLINQFLFAVLVPSKYVGTRIVIKIAVTEDVTGRFADWAFSRAGRSTDLPLSLTDAAASAHFEFRAPLGLRVANVDLLDDRDETLNPPGPSITAGGTAHLTGLEQLASASGGGVRARVELEPVADGFVRQTALATAFVILFLVVGALRDEQLRDALAANRGGAVAAAALAVPALFLSIQARPPEHAWVARALFVPRLLNVVTAVVLYVAAIYLVTVRADDPALSTMLWVFVGAQVLPTAFAWTLLYIVSAPSPTVPDTGK